MSDYLETTVDKFIFRVAKDCYYNSEGVWAKGEGKLIRIGISDYLQQRSGDVAFAQASPVGTWLAAGDEAAVIETIKVNISLSSPVDGQVVEVNPALELSPEVINQDPYGEGWLALIEVADWPAQAARLMDAEAYFGRMKAEAEAEVGR